MVLVEGNTYTVTLENGRSAMAKFEGGFLIALKKMTIPHMGLDLTPLWTEKGQADFFINLSYSSGLSARGYDVDFVKLTQETGE